MFLPRIYPETLSIPSTEEGKSDLIIPGISPIFQFYCAIIWEILKRDKLFIKLFKERKYNEIDRVFQTNLKSSINKKIFKPGIPFSEAAQHQSFRMSFYDFLPHPPYKEFFNDLATSGIKNFNQLYTENSKLRKPQVLLLLAQCLASNPHMTTEVKSEYYNQAMTVIFESKSPSFSPQQMSFLDIYKDGFDFLENIDLERLEIHRSYQNSISKKTLLNIEAMLTKIRDIRYRSHDYTLLYPDTKMSYYDEERKTWRNGALSASKTRIMANRSYSEAYYYLFKSDDAKLTDSYLSGDYKSGSFYPEKKINFSFPRHENAKQTFKDLYGNDLLKTVCKFLKKNSSEIVSSNFPISECRNLGKRFLSTLNKDQMEGKEIACFGGVTRPTSKDLKTYRLFCTVEDGLRITITTLVENSDTTVYSLYITDNTNDLSTFRTDHFSHTGIISRASSKNSEVTEHDFGTISP